MRKGVKKGIGKKWLTLCMAFVLLLGVSGGIHTATVRGNSSSVRESVAVVVPCLESEDGQLIALGTGTGFFVGDTDSDAKYIVTNHHVIEDFLEYGAGEWHSETIGNDTIRVKTKLRVYFDSDDYTEAYVVDYDATKDIALLELESATDKRKALPLCSPTDDMVGSTISVVGYPGLSDNAVIDSTSAWGMNDASVTTGTIGRLVTESGTGVKRIQTDATMQHGNSGGPMVNQDNAVIGISVMSVTSGDSDEKQYYAINIDELIPMLKLHNVPYEIAGSFHISQMMLFIIIGAVVVLAVIIVVLVLVLGKKKPKSSSAAKAQSAPNAQGAGTAGNPVVRSMSVQHSGASFPLNGKQILIGRDTAACTVVFRPDTPGISGRHCSLSWDASTGEFILTDLKSTYGTFLANGQKLTSGVPYRLKKGEHFYLGENANMLSVGLE
ncbi:MAG: trypsin-like peptidase domain-containing protein [Lachnospiraceae bacterium]|nr:trypsin-like peptidase domain-containing protein [Lachnospiraceae bacterium]